VDNPLEREAEDFDRRWTELAGLLEAEMGGTPSREPGPSRQDPGAGAAQGTDAGAGESSANDPSPTEGIDTPISRPPAAANAVSESVGEALADLAAGLDPWADRPPLEEVETDRGERPSQTAAGPSDPGLHGSGPRDWGAPEVEEHFEPPVPPPVTAAEPLLVLAWTASVIGLGGLALLVVFHLLVPWFVPRALGLLALAGVATLIWRMPHKRTDPDDPGAQV
jgi:hypothetical protein